MAARDEDVDHERVFLGVQFFHDQVNFRPVNREPDKGFSNSS